eukprot:NODE_190_length_13461_cov_0.525595.p4 type:complete len:365 gc:universal NODE_190_length_13461_cov_0.525595:8499-9593(+)
MLLPLTLLYARVSNVNALDVTFEVIANNWEQIRNCANGDSNACHFGLSEQEKTALLQTYGKVDKFMSGQSHASNLPFGHDYSEDLVGNVEFYLANPSELPSFNRIMAMIKRSDVVSDRHINVKKRSDDDNVNIEAGNAPVNAVNPDSANRPGSEVQRRISNLHNRHMSFHLEIRDKLRLLTTLRLFAFIAVGFLFIIGTIVGGVFAGKSLYLANHASDRAYSDLNLNCHYVSKCVFDLDPTETVAVRKKIKKTCKKNGKSYDCSYWYTDYIEKPIKFFNRFTGLNLNPEMTTYVKDNLCTIFNIGQLKSEDAQSLCTTKEQDYLHLKTNTLGRKVLMGVDVSGFALGLAMVTYGIWAHKTGRMK